MRLGGFYTILTKERGIGLQETENCGKVMKKYTHKGPIERYGLFE